MIRAGMADPCSYVCELQYMPGEPTGQQHSCGFAGRAI